MTASSKQAEAPRAAGADFNAYRDTYREEVANSIAFSGASPEYFSKAKAEHLLDLATSELSDPAGIDALDVGCGVGETHRFLEGRFKSLVGVDIAGEAVARAAEANPWAGYRSYGPGERLPAEDASADLTFAICVLHHVEPPERPDCVAEMVRVTRPGGLVAIFEHNPWNPLTRRSVRNCVFDEGVKLLRRAESRRLLAAQGLVPIADPFIVFFTGDWRYRRRTERGLRRLPLGAQYYVAARRPSDGARA